MLHTPFPGQNHLFGVLRSLPVKILKRDCKNTQNPFKINELPNCPYNLIYLKEYKKAFFFRGTFYNVFKLDTRCTYSCIGASGKKIAETPMRGFQ